MFDTPDDLLASLTIVHLLKDATPEECSKAAFIFIGVSSIAIPAIFIFAIVLVCVLF
ncbi:MAG: hypothetical protein ABIH88_01435 [Patescibacteria group bacterium]|nr:hypothetical protein [Patescibacteria group bacterium]